MKPGRADDPEQVKVVRVRRSVAVGLTAEVLPK